MCWFKHFGATVIIVPELYSEMVFRILAMRRRGGDKTNKHPANIQLLSHIT